MPDGMVANLSAFMWLEEPVGEVWEGSKKGAAPAGRGTCQGH